VLAGAAASLAAPVLPALAESTLVTRQQAYTRYVPRIERGRDYWAGKLRKSITNSDWETLKKELEPPGKKDKGGALVKITPAMRLWASSFSGKTLSDKTLAMQAAVDEIDECIKSLDVAAQGKISGGLFSFITGGKTMDNSQRTALAQAAYKKGVSAFNKYIELGNDGIGVAFAPVDLID